MSKVIGIDLGTTNSRLAVYDGEKVWVIPNEIGERMTPSVVAHTRTGERLIGRAAKRQAITNVERTVHSIKKYMGTNHRVSVDAERYAPQTISAMILARLKKDAENFLGEPVTRAVITVPAFFSSAQRQAVMDAAVIAGFEEPSFSGIHRIIDDSTAAALAYGFNKEELQRVIVFDLGGGSFEVSVAECDKQMVEVLSVAGNESLGGDDFDQCISDYLVDKFKEETGIDLTKDYTAMCRVREAAEIAKNELSYINTAMINIPFLSADAAGPKHMEYALTRSKFDDLTRHLVKQITAQVQRAIVDSGRNVSELDELIMVGGASRIPAVRDAVCKLTGKEPFKGIDPDEAAVTGAALLGALINGDIRDYFALEVLPVSIGVETAGNVFTPIIQRNTTIPCLVKQVFSTSEDFQQTIEMNVLQGESTVASENDRLGTFRMEGIPMAARGIPRIEVTFSIDNNGGVDVSAEDLATGERKKLIISNSTDMSKYEIAQAKRDVEAYASAYNG